jgi:sugar phosphate isomerase/epimerase
MNLNRRDFGKLALAAAATPAISLLAAKPNSVYSGVQIGVITYSFRDMPDAHTDAEKMLKYIVDSGASGIELMADVAEAYAGAPAGRGGGGARGGSGGGDAARGAPRGGAGGGQSLKEWRLSVSMDKYKAFRKMYNDAGVSIYTLKLPPTPNMSDEEFDYIYNVAAALGANSVTTELPVPDNPAYSQRCGDFALKHGLVTAYHCHEKATITAWDTVLAQSKGNAVNLDCGHYVAGTGQSPIPAIEKLHDRISSLHLKDRSPGGAQAPNLPWGQAETPIVEILQLMKNNRYRFPASVELEYQIPAGSDSVIEVKKCIEYARKALA